MRGRIFLCFVFVYLSSVLAYVAKKNCQNCIGYRSCDAAVTLLNKKDPVADTKLKNAFCGFDSNKLPMVCCLELSNITPTSGSEDASVEDHPNLGLLPERCGRINGDKIIGGHSAGLYEYPWMVLISFQTRLGVEFKCGGSLINNRYVLTAAHCIVGQRLAGVRVGENDIDTTIDCQGKPPSLLCESHIEDLHIESAIAHPNFQGKPRITNDVGLLRLAKPADFSFNNTGAICLPVTRELLNKDVRGQIGSVAGWGFTETTYISSKLLTVDVPIHTQESCSQLYNRGNPPDAEDNTLNKLCAGQTGKDSCGGDSGGPLMVKGAFKNLGDRYIQHGIVSYGPRQCGSNFPGVYTDVSKYMKWILDNIKP